MITKSFLTEFDRLTTQVYYLERKTITKIKNQGTMAMLIAVAIILVSCVVWN